jgi:protein-S-isoprenylcysteine O-methyltransferase Ste14
MTAASGDLAVFVAGSLAMAWVSRKPLRHPGSHGFYRFFAWVGLLALVSTSHRSWGLEPLSTREMVSWGLFCASIALVALGMATLVKLGRAGGQRSGGALYDWEKTTALVTTGIFAYIRHPMYASLMAFDLGAFLQAPSLFAAAFALPVSVLLLLTALADERECLDYFGADYAEYMRRTRRFIPGVF